MTDASPIVAIVMGSRSDLSVMKPAADVLDELGVAREVYVYSAHRTPDEALAFAAGAAARGVRVIIAGAGGAAHLPGVLAAKTHLPVLGVPIASTAMMGGLDAMLAIAQMPPGVPVGCMGVGAWGAKNAGLLAARMLATTDKALEQRLLAWIDEQTAKVLAAGGQVSDEELAKA